MGNEIEKESEEDKKKREDREEKEKESKLHEEKEGPHLLTEDHPHKYGSEKRG